MKLYHLDWEKSVIVNEERHLQLIMPVVEKDQIAQLYNEAFSQELYDLVAEVETEDLNYVYTATNNGVISDNWSTEPPKDVRPVEPSIVGDLGRRSTCVGDIIDFDGKLHVVAPIGFFVIEADIISSPRL